MQMMLPANALATVHFSTNQGMSILGTAFCFMKPTWFMTAKHVVVEDCQLRENISIATLEPNGSTKPLLKFSHVYYHSDLDIAILQLNKPACKKPLFPAHHDFAGKKGLIKLAYSPSETKDKEGIVYNATHIKQYKVTELIRDFGIETRFQFEDQSAEGGNSGAPIFGEAGNVIGIIIDGKFDDENKMRCTVATDIQAMIDMIELDPMGNSNVLNVEEVHHTHKRV